VAKPVGSETKFLLSSEEFSGLKSFAFSITFKKFR
jgi:hypothetical protein